MKPSTVSLQDTAELRQPSRQLMPAYRLSLVSNEFCQHEPASPPSDADFIPAAEISAMNQFVPYPDCEQTRRSNRTTKMKALLLTCLGIMLIAGMTPADAASKKKREAKKPAQTEIAAPKKDKTNCMPRGSMRREDRSRFDIPVC